jgi:predicted negative regulator of RcsB-dependent stress response
MATASRRITRKQIRQPDWFQVASENALDYFQDHKALVYSALAGLIVLLSVIWGWQVFKDNQNAAASQEFSSAVALYQGEKYRDAISNFEKVAGYRWSRYAGLAHLYQANSYVALNELDKGLSAAQRAVAATAPDTLYRQLALMTLANVEERKNQCKSAIDHYGEAQKISGALQNDAALGKARCLELTGDLAGAIAVYKEIMKEAAGNSSVGTKISELEAKTPVKALGK